VSFDRGGSCECAPTAPDSDAAGSSPNDTLGRARHAHSPDPAAEDLHPIHTAHGRMVELGELYDRFRMLDLNDDECRCATAALRCLRIAGEWSQQAEVPAEIREMTRRMTEMIRHMKSARGGSRATTAKPKRSTRKSAPIN